MFCSLTNFIASLGNLSRPLAYLYWLRKRYYISLHSNCDSNENLFASWRLGISQIPHDMLISQIRLKDVALIFGLVNLHCLERFFSHYPRGFYALLSMTSEIRLEMLKNFCKVASKRKPFLPSSWSINIFGLCVYFSCVYHVADNNPCKIDVPLLHEQFVKYIGFLPSES